MPMTHSIFLRDVTEADLIIFFEHQRDPDAARMAGFPSRERDAFMAHWEKILANPAIDKQTILFDGQVAGNIVGFEQNGEREVGYWLGKEFWEQGIATQALAAFLDQVTTRPLYARVIHANIGSRRVLEKCGFQVAGEEGEELILRLDV